MIGVAFVIYRSWAYGIFQSVIKLQKQMGGFEVRLLLVSPHAEFNPHPQEYALHTISPTDTQSIFALLNKYQIHIACFYGWSNLISDAVWENFICLGLHPSDLPQFRGGSPLQHQIISGVINSKLTLFKISGGVDAGPIYHKNPLSLRGEIQEIFRRMTHAGSLLTKQFLSDYLTQHCVFMPQKNLSCFPPYKRRQPEDSKLLLQQIRHWTFDQLYNFVRALGDPYPNAFIDMHDNRLYVKTVNKTKQTHPHHVINQNQIDLGALIRKKGRPKLYLKLRSGHAYISRWNISSQTQKHT